MGLLQKIEKDPSLRIKDWRSDISSSGPMIRARMKGARSYFSLRNMYPKIPEPNRTRRSKVLELTD